MKSSKAVHTAIVEITGALVTATLFLGTSLSITFTNVFGGINLLNMESQLHGHFVGLPSAAHNRHPMSATDKRHLTLTTKPTQCIVTLRCNCNVAHSRNDNRNGTAKCVPDPHVRACLAHAQSTLFMRHKEEPLKYMTHKQPKQPKHHDPRKLQTLVFVARNQPGL